MAKHRIIKDGFGYSVEIKILWFWVDAQLFSEDPGFDTLEDAKKWIAKRTEKRTLMQP